MNPPNRDVLFRQPERLVFDPRLWGGKDVGDNSQFWKAATLIAVRSNRWGEEFATVRFHHDGRLSHGHFTEAMRGA